MYFIQGFSMRVPMCNVAVLGALLFIMSVTPSWATVFYSKEEAMVLAFGEGAKIEMLSLFPDEQQLAQIEQLAKVKLDSGMFTFYVGKNNDTVTAYAAIESITVRTKPETLLIVLTPDGHLRNVYTLAFHEPPEYQPPERWFEQLYQRNVEDLEFNKGVDGISGATLSTRASLTSIRKVMAIYRVMMHEKKEP
jgi:Na+-translocating ferredoxin:NAD+ oxidoreductase RnfG subunit